MSKAVSRTVWPSEYEQKDPAGGVLTVSLYPPSKSEQRRMKVQKESTQVNVYIHTYAVNGLVKHSDPTILEWSDYDSKYVANISNQRDAQLLSSKVIETHNVPN